MRVIVSFLTPVIPFVVLLPIGVRIAVAQLVDHRVAADAHVVLHHLFKHNGGADFAISLKLETVLELEHLPSIQSLAFVLLKAFVNEILQNEVEFRRIPLETPHHDVLLDLLRISTFERVLFSAQIIKAASERPDVYFRGESLPLLNQLRGGVIHMPAEVIFLKKLLIVIGHPNQVEFSESKSGVNPCRVDIPMNQSLLMHIGESLA